MCGSPYQQILEHSRVPYTKLQRILFFKPIDEPPGANLIFANNTKKNHPSDPNGIFAETNPLLQKHFGSVLFHAERPPYSRIISTIAVFQNRLPWSSLELDENAKPERTRLYEAFTYEQASWRRMLVSQPPPPPILTILESQQLGEDPGTIWKTFIYAESCRYDFTGSEPPPESLKQGLRFGLLYDAVQSIAASCTSEPDRVVHCTGWGSDLVARRVKVRPRNGIFIRILYRGSAIPVCLINKRQLSIRRFDRRVFVRLISIRMHQRSGITSKVGSHEDWS